MNGTMEVQKPDQHLEFKRSPLFHRIPAGRIFRCLRSIAEKTPRQNSGLSRTTADTF
jgi:hypothetical protein